MNIIKILIINLLLYVGCFSIFTTQQNYSFIFELVQEFPLKAKKYLKYFDRTYIQRKPKVKTTGKILLIVDHILKENGGQLQKIMHLVYSEHQIMLNHGIINFSNIIAHNHPHIYSLVHIITKKNNTVEGIYKLMFYYNLPCVSLHKAAQVQKNAMQKTIEKG